MVERVIWEEIEVKVPATEAWKLYGGVQLAPVVCAGVPNLLSRCEVVEGDGSVGTIIQVFLPPGEGGTTSYKEKYTVVDDEKRVKEAVVVEGGALDLGFSLYRFRFEVIEKEGKEEEECIVRFSIDYELKDEAAAIANAALLSNEPLRAILQVTADYVTKNYTTV